MTVCAISAARSTARKQSTSQFRTIITALFRTIESLGSVDSDVLKKISAAGEVDGWMFPDFA